MIQLYLYLRTDATAGGQSSAIKNCGNRITVHRKLLFVGRRLRHHEGVMGSDSCCKFIHLSKWDSLQGQQATV